MRTIKSIIVLIFALSCMSVSAQRWGATPQDSLDCIRNLSMYQEFFNQRNFIDAFVPWKRVLELCPANHINVFIRGNTILHHKIARERDPEKRREYIEMLINLWDKRTQYFGDAGRNMGYKAIDMRRFMPEKVNEAYELLGKALEMGVGTGSREVVIPFNFFEAAMANERAGNISKEDVLEAYDIASTYLEKMYKANPDSIIMDAMANLDIAFEPYATCEEIIPIFERRYEENKHDIAFLEKVTKVLDHKDCNDSELFFRATEDLHALRPNPRTAYLIAKMHDGRRAFLEVISVLRDDADNLDNDRDRVRAHLLLAKAYLNVNRYREGRESARRALEINPNEGQAYFLIGMMYASSARSCGGDDPQVGQRAAFWAAVDKFIRAREVDPNRARQASEMIALYSQHFPSGDDLFFQGITEGSTFRVGCWIQESTIVRRRR